MNNDDRNPPQGHEPELTLADIEELRRTLGAEADVSQDFDETLAAVPRTVMCPQWF